MILLHEVLDTPSLKEFWICKLAHILELIGGRWVSIVLVNLLFSQPRIFSAYTDQVIFLSPVYFTYRNTWWTSQHRRFMGLIFFWFLLSLMVTNIHFIFGGWMVSIGPFHSKIKLFSLHLGFTVELLDDHQKVWLTE